MSEHREAGPRMQEERAEKASVKKIPERVALWRSIVRDSKLSEVGKEALDNQVSFLLSVTPKYEATAFPGPFSTTGQRLDMLTENLFNVCHQNAGNDDMRDVGAVYQMLASDIAALKEELYQ